MIYLQLFLSAVLGYLLGNIQTGLIIGRLTRNIDLRKHGSGSSGATNALRVLGSQQALLTLLGDALKGVVAVCVGLIICGRQGGMIAGLLVAVGHIWPVLFGFHGGKGVATSIGVLLVLMPLHMLLVLSVGIVVILLTKMVSVGSISAAGVYLVAATITAIAQKDVFLFVFSLLMSFLIVFAHRGNIGRVLSGNENKISAKMFRK